MSLTDPELAAALGDFIGQQTGQASGVRALTRLAGGASRLSYGFTLGAADRAGPQDRVLRLDRLGGLATSDRRQEFAVLGAAHRAGVRVPEVHWLGGEGDGLGGAFIVMERVGGEALGRRLLRDQRYAEARSRLPAQLAAELVRTHRIDPGQAGLALPSDGAAAGAPAEVGRYLELLGLVCGGRPQPVLELAGRWLKAKAPPLDRTGLVHGDFRVGNFMFDETGLVAVLDWELAHAGDPLEDISWLSVRSWRFGNESAAVGGLCSRREFARFYEEAGGAELDPVRLAYWELFGNWKWAIICMMQAASYRAGPRPDLELAAIGRRVAEVEWEILALLDDIESGSLGWN